LGVIDSYSKHFRRDFEITEDDIVFLQATRIVPRKRVELSIELISKMNLPRIVLVISGNEGDEQRGYLKKLKEMVRSLNISCKFIGDRVNSQRKIVGGKRVYSLWDCYANSDFVTYPTEMEGFGNQFVETMYFKKPIVLTPYEVYKSDIKPLGFEIIEMPDRVTDDVIKQIRQTLEDPEKKERVVERNFELGKKHFSYEVVQKKLLKIFKEMNLL